jgi:hypothetical protein
MKPDDSPAQPVRLLVIQPQGNIEEWDAERWDITDGALTVFDHAKNAICSYASGSWIQVLLDTPEDDS